MKIRISTLTKNLPLPIFSSFGEAENFINENTEIFDSNELISVTDYDSMPCTRFYRAELTIKINRVLD